MAGPDTPAEIPTLESGYVSAEAGTFTEGAYHTPYGYVYVLTGADMSIEGYVINTDSFIVNSHAVAGIMGFDRQSPEELEFQGPRLGVSELGYTAGTTDEADIEGSFLKEGSIGLGYIPMTTYYLGYNSTAHLFFNYSNMSREASFKITDDMVDSNLSASPIRQKFTAPGPDVVTYGASEGGALQNKFGYSESLMIGDTASVVYNGIAASIEEVVESLVTTFPLSKKTFQRTKPLKIRTEDINAITGEEGDTTATTTTTTTSTATGLGTADTTPSAATTSTTTTPTTSY